MSRHKSFARVLLAFLLIASVGCHPTQPFYFREDGDLSHYIDKATELDYPDVETPTLAEVKYAEAPYTLSNPEFREFWDLTLEEVVSMGMNNSKVIRSVGSVNRSPDNTLGAPDALLNNPQQVSTVYDPAVFETDPQQGVAAALAEFDAQFSSSIFWQIQDRPQNRVATGPLGNFQPVLFQQDSAQFDAEIRKRTATGTQFAVRNQTTYTWNNTSQDFRPLPSEWFTAFEAEAVQPLLRNRGAQVNRIPVVLARIRTDISLAQFEINVRNFLRDLEFSYWDLYTAYRNLETSKTARDSALGVWRNTHLKLVRGAASTQQEAQAREQYFFFRSQVETAFRDLLDQEMQLRYLMGLAPTDGRLIRPIDEPVSAPVEFDWREVHCEALARSPELRQQKWAIKQQEMQLIAARNQLLPELNVQALYRWLGAGDDLLDPDRPGRNFPLEDSTAFGTLTEGDFQEWRLGVEFIPPRFGARAELAGVRNSQLTLARERARLEDMELNLSHVISSALRGLDTNYQLAQTNLNRVAAAQDELQALELIQQQGGAVQTGNIFDLVLEAQRRRAQAEIEYHQALSSYSKTIADVHFRKGTLLEYNGVKLAEGPWPKKAYWDALGHARRRDASYYLNYGWTRPSVISRGPISQEPAPEHLEGGLPAEGELVPAPMPTPDSPPSELPPQPEEELPRPAPQGEPPGDEITLSQPTSTARKTDWARPIGTGTAGAKRR